MVVMLSPSCITASVRQELIRRPSTITVHAPHWPWSQPFLVPVRCRCSRSASSSVSPRVELQRTDLPVDLERDLGHSGLSGSRTLCDGCGRQRDRRNGRGPGDQELAPGHLAPFPIVAVVLFHVVVPSDSSGVPNCDLSQGFPPRSSVSVRD